MNYNNYYTQRVGCEYGHNSSAVASTTAANKHHSIPSDENYSMTILVAVLFVACIVFYKLILSNRASETLTV